MGNINIGKILKECEMDTPIYSLAHGEVRLYKVDDDYNIFVRRVTGDNFYGIDMFEPDGRIVPSGEVMLYPSKYDRDWTMFKKPIKKFNPSEFKPFDKVLVRAQDHDEWECGIVSHFVGDAPDEPKHVVLIGRPGNMQVIPFMSNTCSLLGTKNSCSDFYKWWKY
jgi:hypothetical protein